MTEYELKTPITEKDVRMLRAGDTIFLSGRMITARDDAHHKALEFFKKGEPLPVDFEGMVIYHCGPIMRQVQGKWEVVAAGPTTSTRMDLFEDEFIEAFKARVIVGKGGMGERTAKACEKVGAVYGAFTGGAALLAKQAIVEVEDVFWLDELGMPECLWVYRIDRFGPVAVAIDSFGTNLFTQMYSQMEKNKPRAYELAGLK